LNDLSRPFGTLGRRDSREPTRFGTRLALEFLDPTMPGADRSLAPKKLAPGNKCDRRLPKRLRSSPEGLSVAAGIASDDDESDDGSLQHDCRRLKVLSPIYQNGVALPLRRGRPRMRHEKPAKRQFHVLVDRQVTGAAHGGSGARKAGLRDRMEDAVRNAFHRGRKRKREQGGDTVVHLPMRRTRSSVKLAEDGRSSALEDVIEVDKDDEDDEEEDDDADNGAVDEDPGECFGATCCCASVVMLNGLAARQTTTFIFALLQHGNLRVFARTSSSNSTPVYHVRL
jgi:hypothetical protein